MTLQPNMIATMIVAMLASAAAKYGIDQPTLSAFVQAFVALAAAVYTYWQTSRDKQIAAVSVASGVAKVVMKTDAAASSPALAASENVVGPSAVPAMAASLPSVKAVVMTSQAAADDIPHQDVVGPSKLKAA